MDDAEGNPGRVHRVRQHVYVNHDLKGTGCDFVFQLGAEWSGGGFTGRRKESKKRSRPVT
jgi:hypothetical protein